MAENKTITVAGCQMLQNLGNRDANIRTAMEMIQATPGHDIYVLPELSSSGYDESVFNRLEELAEDWDGKSYRAFSRLSKELDCHICYSAVEKEISLLLHPGGWPRDKGFFTWHTFVTTRAVENTIYIMSTNWAGLNNGGTAFCPPFVDGDEACLNKLKTKPDVLIGTVDTAHLENVKKKYPYIKDRNQDMYAELAKRP